MSRFEEKRSEKSYGYQKASADEVDDVVRRLSAPKKPKEEQGPPRRRKVEPEMTAAEIDQMVNRLMSAAKPRVPRKTAYEQGGVCLSYASTGFDKSGSGGKFMEKVIPSGLMFSCQ